jgi:hypothetical protein
MFLPLVLAALALSPEVPVSTDVIRNAPRWQAQPSVASDGSQFFAAWEDRTDVVGSRLDATGKAIDRRGGISLQPTRADDRSPSVVWNGDTYMIAIAIGTQWPYGIKGVEVTTGGEVIREKTVVHPRYVSHTALAWNGSVYLLTWIESRTDGEPGYLARALLLDRDLGPVGSEILLGPAEYGSIAVASNGENFLAAWRFGGAYAGTISSSGVVSTPARLSTSASSVDVASNGSSYAVFAGGAEIVALDGGGVETGTVAMPEGGSAALAWTGMHWVAAWTSPAVYPAPTKILVAELDAALTFIRSPERLIDRETHQADPAIAANPQGTLILWSEASNALSPPDVRSAFLDDPGAHSLLSTDLADQVPVDAAWSAQSLGVLWREGDDTGERLLFGRVSRDGALLSGEGVEMPAASSASIASNGTVFAIAAARDSGVEVQLRAESGEALVAVVVGQGTRVRIASDGRDFFVSWRGPGDEVFSRKVAADGTLGGTHTIPEVGHPNLTRAPRAVVAIEGAHTVLVEERYDAKIASWVVTSTTIDAGGTVRAPAIVTQGGGLYHSINSSMTTNGEEMLYAWSLGVQLYAKLGIDGPESMVLQENLALVLLDVAWDGAEFVYLVTSGVQSFLLRGNERIGTGGPAWPPSTLIAAAPGHRVAVVTTKTIERNPGLSTLKADRAIVRFVDAKSRRRAVRQ